MITVERIDYSMSQEVHVGGSVRVPSGVYDVTTVIGGAYNPGVSTEVVTGPVTHPIDVTHFVLRKDVPYSSNVAVTMRNQSTGAKTIYNGRSAIVDEWPDHSAAPIGTHMSPHLDNFVSTMALLPTQGVVGIGIAWFTFEPTDGTFSSTQIALYDAVFAECASRGIKVIVTCGTTPGWDGGGGSNLNPPNHPARHAAFVAFVVDRWGDQILCVNPWNEPNLSTFWPGTDAQYVTLLAADRAAVDPAMPVCLGPISLNDWTYVDGLFSVGLTGDMFDWVDFHPYPYTLHGANGIDFIDPRIVPSPDQYDGSVIVGIEKIKSVLASHEIFDRNFVISEIGVSANAVDSVNPQTRFTSAGAASFLGTCIDLLRRLDGVQAVVIHEGKDDSTGIGWNYSFGLLDQNNNRRDSWAMLAAINA